MMGITFPKISDFGKVVPFDIPPILVYNGSVP